MVINILIFFIIHINNLQQKYLIWSSFFNIQAWPLPNSIIFKRQYSPSWLLYQPVIAACLLLLNPTCCNQGNRAHTAAHPFPEKLIPFSYFLSIKYQVAKIVMHTWQDKDVAHWSNFLRLLSGLKFLGHASRRFQKRQGWFCCTTCKWQFQWPCNMYQFESLLVKLQITIRKWPIHFLNKLWMQIWWSIVNLVLGPPFSLR